ncbi:rod-determining factor RdfA [Haloplanus salinarum]|uniref:rod-determining factor RdfA n=1 Tax=Haloplanus salinarum TaxID=1912324 RepID=UPI003B430B73
MSDDSNKTPVARRSGPAGYSGDLLDGEPGNYKHCCKVGRMADKYDLTTAVTGMDIHKELLAKWLGINEFPETSVRGLVSWFNQKIMRTHYLDHGRKDTEKKFSVEYEAFAGNDEDRRLWIEEELEQDGIDPDVLDDDFLSTATMYRHLTNCLGAEKETDSDPDSNWERENVDFVRERATSNIIDTLKSWDRKDVLPGGSDAKISIAIDLTCPVCSTSVPIRQARQRGYVCEDHLGSRADLDDDSDDDLDTDPDANVE